MRADPRIDRQRAQLMRQLQRQYEPVRSRSVETLLQQTDRPAMRGGLSLEVAGHAELEVDLLLFEPRTHTLGMVQWLRPDGASGGEPAEQVQARIDEATYLRHLLQIEEPPGRPSAVDVELVLVLPADPMVNGQVTSALREVAEKTDLLRAIGVGLVHAPPKGAFDGDELRRAFAWLLRDVRTWFTEPPPRIAHRTRLTVRRPRSLRLQDFRLPGQRLVELEQARPVHLFHGHNGSGKSSLVEAIELACTARIARLKGVADPDRVLRNRGAKQRARIAIDFGPGDNYELEVGRGWPRKRLAPGLDANALRLNQRTMDQLARANSADRARVFLKAFFPRDARVVEKLYAAQDALDLAVAALPMGPDPEPAEMAWGTNQEPLAVAAELASRQEWMRDGATVSQAVLHDFLPMSPRSLGHLANISSDLKSVRNRIVNPSAMMAAELRSLLADLDQALDAIRGEASALLRDCALARDGLEGLRSWRAKSSSAPDEDYRTLLDGWLEARALEDMVGKRAQVARIFERAVAAGWTPEGEEGELLNSTLPLPNDLAARLEALHARLTEECQDRDRRLQAAKARRDDRGPDVERAVVRPTRRQFEALDRVGATLDERGKSRNQRLGDDIDTALTKSHPVSFGGLEVGEGDWTKPFLDRLTAVAQALAELEGDPSTPWIGAVDRMERIWKVVDAHDELRKQEKLVEKTFIRNLSTIEAPLNEVIALFSPARWAYEDVKLSYSQGSRGKHQLELTTGDHGTRAELVWNTAELNVFTLALFLLCAPQTRNPLRLLVFDDPLQNMDELTVTSFARGFSRLQTLIGGDWQFLFLFHGEEDLERFSREVPAAIYHLPWVSPFNIGDKGPIRAQPRHAERLPPAPPLHETIVEV